MKSKSIILAVLILLAALPASVLGQRKLAQTGLKFLQLSTDAKVASMGDAVTALENNSSAMFFNPAAMARINSFADITLGSIQYIADIKYYYATAAFAPFDSKYGVAGISMEYVDYGDFIGTIIDGTSSLGYIETGIFKPKAYCFGLSYANALSDKFSVGGTIKYAAQDLTSSVVAYTDGVMTKKSYKPDALAFDFGVLYHTGIQSLDFGLSIRNFSKEVKLEDEGFQLPLLFQIGIAYNLSDFLKLDKKVHSIQLALDANHPRDFDEQVMFGIEYKFMNMFSVRAGYASPNDEHDFTAGVGFVKNIEGVDLSIDYCYTPWTTFADVHRYSLHVAL